jgi:hypothetical protein
LTVQIFDAGVKVHLGNEAETDAEEKEKEGEAGQTVQLGLSSQAGM